MDEALAKKLRKRAIRYCEKKGLEQDAEDFAQNMLVRFLQGEGKGQTVDQAMIDEIRKKYGRTRTKENKKKKGYQDRGKASKYDPPFVPIEELLDVGVEENFGEDVQTLEYHLQELPMLERGIVILSVVYGYELREIARMFLVTKARVSQIVRDCVVKIQKDVDSKASDDKVEP